MSLMPVAEALQRLLGDAGALTDHEELPLDQAAGRVLAEDLTAARNQPPFPASAMDGYAVRAADTAAGAELAVIGESAAGHAFSDGLSGGQAVRIFTGAPVPEGADAILIQENAEALGGGRIRMLEPVETGRHIRPEGIDFKAGERVLEAGSVLDAGRLTAAAAMNLPMLKVLRRPRIALLATGDELVAPGAKPRADQIIASNSFGVAAIAREAGAEVVDLGIAADTTEALGAAIRKAQEAKADILVTLGGASVGDHDLVQDAMKAAGMTLDFWKIAMRPGKPLMSGRLGPMRILGLPGNPVSSLVCAHLFLKPLARRIAGLPEAGDAGKGILGRDLPENDRRQDYLRARISRDSEGRLVATPHERQDSSLMRLFAEADALVIRPPHAPPASAGEPCDIVFLRRPA